MTLSAGWDTCDVPRATWADLSLRLKSEVARRLRAPEKSDSLLSWGRKYLPSHFRRAPSNMHLWLGQHLDNMLNQRGTRLNVIGPRGAAKSTVGTLAYLLRAAVEGWEP